MESRRPTGLASSGKDRRSITNKQRQDAADVLTFANSYQIGEFDAMVSLLLPPDQAQAVRQPFEASLSRDTMFSAWGPGARSGAGCRSTYMDRRRNPYS